MLRSLAEPLGRLPADTRITVHHLLERAQPSREEGMRLVQRDGKAYLVPESSLVRFDSRRGAEDVEESRRQACIAMLHGDRLLDYLGDRVAVGDLEVGDWRERATRLGLDAARIGMCAGSGQADARLETDRQLADSLGVSTPTIVVGNRLRFDGLGPWNWGAFHRAAVERSAEGARKQEFLH
jgi:hypothetical protein